MAKRVLLFLSASVLIVVTACQPATPPPPEGIPQRADNPNSNAGDPIPEAPEWTEPTDLITLDNVTEIAHLGRLDQEIDEPKTVFAYDFSPDSTQFVGMTDGEIIGWDLISGERQFRTSRLRANQVFYSPDKTEVYTLDNAGVIHVYSTNGGIQQTNFEAHADYNGTYAYDNFDGWLALGGIIGEVKVWDMLERRSVVTLDAHRLQVAGLAFSHGGSLLATVGDEGTVKIWDWQQREVVTEIELEGDDVEAMQIAFSHDDSEVAVGTLNDVRLFNAATGEQRIRIEIPQGGVVAFMVYSPDDSVLATAGQQQDVVLWNTETGELFAQLPDIGGIRVSVTFSPDSTMLVATALDAPVTLWDMTTITDETIGRANLDIGSDQIIIADWTDDGRLLAFIDARGPVYFWGVPPITETESQAAESEADGEDSAAS